MKIIKACGKALWSLLLCVVVVALLVLSVLKVAKFAIYSDYYALEESLCDNPGLSDGFVCQGIAVSETDGKYFISGYMADGSASRIYVTDKDDNSYYVALKKANGEDYTGHAGGIAYHDGTLYVASDSLLYPVSAGEVLSAKEGDVIQMQEGIAVNSAASFVYTDDNYFYVGEFHDGGKYVTNHPYDTAEGMHYAIVSRYKLNDLSKPDKVYSIRNKVQGLCFTPDGQVVMSTSYGLADTVYYVYNEAEAVDSGKTLDGAPVYYLDKCVREVSGPAMGEDVDFSDGKVITLTESASNKYIFGKFFYARKIVALDFSK